MLKNIIFIGALAAPGVYAAEPIAGRATLAVTVNELEAIAVGYSAKKSILGKPVYNGTDKNSIGTVGDLIVTPDRSVSYAIVDVGGFLGIGEKKVAVPAGMFKMEKGKIVLVEASKDALKDLPEFKYAR